jgi:hypothetical protein
MFYDVAPDSDKHSNTGGDSSNTSTIFTIGLTFAGIGTYVFRSLAITATTISARTRYSNGITGTSPKLCSKANRAVMPAPQKD